jgi:hypothetical protein
VAARLICSYSAFEEYRPACFSFFRAVLPSRNIKASLAVVESVTIFLAVVVACPALCSSRVLLFDATLHNVGEDLKIVFSVTIVSFNTSPLVHEADSFFMMVRSASDFKQI